VSFFLALDANGTMTNYVLVDETRELARVRTGTTDRMRTDAETTTQDVDSALRLLTALSVANPGPASVPFWPASRDSLRAKSGSASPY
jgi:predicted NBD/HSP70 family sugar kinase